MAWKCANGCKGIFKQQWEIEDHAKRTGHYGFNWIEDPKSKRFRYNIDALIHFKANTKTEADKKMKAFLKKHTVCGTCDFNRETV